MSKLAEYTASQGLKLAYLFNDALQQQRYGKTTNPRIYPDQRYLTFDRKEEVAMSL